MEKTSKLEEKLTLCLDIDTYNELKAKANNLGLKSSTYLRTVLKEKFNKEINDKNGK